MLSVVATIVNLLRNEIQMRSPSVIDMLTEFAANELEDMEGELAGRCNSLTQHQAMRVCVRLDMIWLDFVSASVATGGRGGYHLEFVLHCRKVDQTLAFRGVAGPLVLSRCFLGA